VEPIPRKRDFAIGRNAGILEPEDSGATSDSEWARSPLARPRTSANRSSSPTPVRACLSPCGRIDVGAPPPYVAHTGHGLGRELLVRRNTVADQTCDRFDEHCHHTRRCEPTTTSAGVSGRFFVGCHSAATAGARVASEVLAAPTLWVVSQTWPHPPQLSTTVTRPDHGQQGSPPNTSAACSGPPGCRRSPKPACDAESRSG
jgi:hypothetical protein